MTQTTQTTSSKPAAQQPPEEPMGFWRKAWVEYLKPFLVVALVLTMARSMFIDWNDVPTGSMKPTIIEGDRILVNKLAYDLKLPYFTWDNQAFPIIKWADPKPGDIVIFFSPKEGTRLVKRVVAGPGDVVQIVDEQLRVNGVAASYAPLQQNIINQVSAGERALTNPKFERETLGRLNHPVMFLPGRYSPAKDFGPKTIPPGYYCMLGDNRDNSQDSRFIGFVPRNSIVGQATRVAVSVDPNNSYAPRWSRFFRALP
ncbi:MAG: signal peptidase I [Tepidisphaerales bacterium]